MFRISPNYANSLQFRKLSLALSMQTKQLTYVGPDSMGPHYLESGKRPLMGEYKSAHVIVQEGDGNVLSAHYDGTNDRFSTYYADNTIRPVCWWHLPAAAPMTEREWWMAQFVPCLPFSELQGFRAKIGAKLYIAGDREEMAEMYDHWVAAGRP